MPGVTPGSVDGEVPPSALAAIFPRDGGDPTWEGEGDELLASS